MEGGVALFLLFVMIVIAAVLVVAFGGLGTGLGAWRAKRAGSRRDRPRPTHSVARDDGSSEAEPGDRL